MWRRLAFVLLVLSTLACSVVTRVTPEAQPPSPEPPPTRLSEATDTPRPVVTETAGPEATETPHPRMTVTPDPAWIALFDQVWQDVRENYVYPDYNGADWDGLYDTYLERVRASKDSEEFYGVMRDLIAELQDDHSVFLSPDEAREDDDAAQGTLNYVGIGILRDVNEEKRRVVILVVFPGSPAERAGLKPHDSILAVDGEPIVDEQGNVYADRIRGPEGTPVTLTVQSVGEEPRDITITRARIEAQYPVIARRLPGDIGYLSVTTFDDLTIGDRTAAAFQELVDSGPPLKGLIFDVRLNHGGYGTVLEQMLGLFTDGTVGHFRTQTERRPLEVRADDIGGSQTLPLVVLVGEGTESFAEVFSGVLQDIGRATVVGTVTTGNVEIIWSHDYEDGSRAWIATETFEPLNSTARWEQTGIIPDQIVPALWDEFTDENDPQIAAALEILQQK